MKVELHSHTNHSKGEKIRIEGLNSPKEMVRQAKRLGLDAIAITDHNEFKGAVEAEREGKRIGITVIKGEEITIAGDRHILGLGLTEKIKRDLSLEETLDAIKAQGGISISPHPFDLANKGIRENAAKCDAIEVFNAINLDRFSNRNAKKFALEKNLVTVAGSDAHCIEMLGYGLTEIKADNSVDSILHAIKNGNTKPVGTYVPISVIEYWSLERFNASYSQVMDYIYRHYSTPKRWVAEHLLSLTKKSPGKIDYFFKGLAYFSFGTAIFYSAAKNAKNLI